ncbi:MAG: S1C family serine protease [Acidimicrobiia bacterium]
MPHDTSGTDSPDSHAPFMPEWNEPQSDGVEQHMNEDTAIEDTSIQDGPVSEPPADSPSDTGEMEAIVPTTPAGAAGTVAFDYDAYYASEPPWPPSEPAAPEQPTPTPRKRDGVMFFVGALAAAFLGAALTVGLLAASGTLSTEEAPTVTETTAVTATATETPTATPQITNTIVNEVGSAVNPAAVALKTLPSIVTVTTLNADDVPSGSGSGVVLDEAGFIATNEHVVSGAASYAITFEDGRIYEAELIGLDPLTDLAVLKIDADELVAVELGSADSLSLGDPAIAVGNPLGQQGGSSISVGIVSAFDRQVDFADDSRLFGMIQTDAAINSGSSGGALVDAEGKLIGITAAIGVSSAGPEGIGYAIPVELVERITSEIIETGDVAHPFLGVTIDSHWEFLDDGAQVPAGARVVTIEGTDSAAGLAGLQPDDIIVRIGDKEITSQTDLILAVRLHRVGDEVEFIALRDGEPIAVTVVMGSRPAEFGG